ncbi:hypothetical protein ACTFIW_006983 [Dictyostelium discoideum]
MGVASSNLVEGGVVPGENINNDETISNNNNNNNISTTTNLLLAADTAIANMASFYQSTLSDDFKLLASENQLPEDLDTFMETLLFSLNFSEESNHNYVYGLLNELSKQLVSNNLKTKNFNRILMHFINKLNLFNQQLITISESMKKNKGSKQQLILDQSVEIQLYTHQQFLVNYTILIQTFSKYIIENMDHVNIIQQFTGDSENSFKTIPFDLILSILGFLSNELRDCSYDLHDVLLRFILILFSTEMYLPLPTIQENYLTDTFTVDFSFYELLAPKTNIFLNILMDTVYNNPNSPIVYSFIFNLFNNIIENKPPPSTSNSLLDSIGSAASYLLLLPLNAYKYFFPQNNATGNSMTELSTFNLLVLVQYNYPKGNPFRKILSNIQDKDFSIDLLNSNPNNHQIRISMQQLYESIIKSPSSDKNILLLYYLLQENSFFFRYVQSRTDLDNLLLPMIQILYNSFEEKPQQVNMILIIILILSQDSLFNENVHSLIVHQILWYKERLLIDVSLGGILMVVLIKSIILNLSKLRDAHLHTNCLAILANLSSNISHIHPYVANRLVKLLEILSKRYIKLKKMLNQVDSPSNNTNTNNSNNNVKDNTNNITQSMSSVSISDDLSLDVNQLQQIKNLENHNSSINKHHNESSHNNSSFLNSPDLNLKELQSEELTTHSEFLYIVLQIINNTLTYRAYSNPHLIYSLLHQQEYFPVFLNEENLSSLSNNILNILSYFSSELKHAINGLSQQETTAETIMSFIESKSKSLPVPPPDQEGILRFKYEEESTSFEFITPYVWSIIFNYSGEKWDTKNITLFPTVDLTTIKSPSVIDANNFTPTKQHSSDQLHSPPTNTTTTTTTTTTNSTSSNTNLNSIPIPPNTQPQQDNLINQEQNQEENDDEKDDKIEKEQATGVELSSTEKTN